MDCFWIQWLTQIRTQPKFITVTGSHIHCLLPYSLFLPLFELDFQCSRSLSAITEGSALSLLHAYSHSAHYTASPHSAKQ